MNHKSELEKSTGIFLFENLVSPSICEDIIERFHQQPDKHYKGEVGLKDYNPNVKISTDWLLPDDLREKLQIYNTIIWNEAKAKYPILEELGVLQQGKIELLHYKKNEGQFKPHIDTSMANKDHVRFLGIIYYLNDVKEGGETHFEYQKIRVRARKGRVIAFPTTWKYLHEGVMPVSNDKYILTSFFSYFRN